MFFFDSKVKVWGYNNIFFDMICKLGWKVDIFYLDYVWVYYVVLLENVDKFCGVYICGELFELILYDIG